MFRNLNLFPTNVNNEARVIGQYISMEFPGIAFYLLALSFSAMQNASAQTPFNDLQKGAKTNGASVG